MRLENGRAVFGGRVRAFTLLELLVVVAIMAILAGGVVMMLGEAQEGASLKIAQSEMQEIKKAILNFKRDTGHFPKQGVFGLVGDGGSVPEPAEGRAWFYSPANFAQLLDNPLQGSGHPLERWDPETGRGWRGPYLSGFGEGEVVVGGDLNSDGSGNPTVGTAVRVPGVADPFAALPVDGYFEWRSGSVIHRRRGRPYFYCFDASTPQAFAESVRIVGLGPNGVYEAGGGDDLVMYLLR